MGYTFSQRKIGNDLAATVGAYDGIHHQIKIADDDGHVITVSPLHARLLRVALDDLIFDCEVADLVYQLNHLRVEPDLILKRADEWRAVNPGTFPGVDIFLNMSAPIERVK